MVTPVVTGAVALVSGKIAVRASLGKVALASAFRMVPVFGRTRSDAVATAILGEIMLAPCGDAHGGRYY